jgi:hypothetical protein
MRFGEKLSTTAHHRVNFVVPDNVKPGIPITISAIAWNAALVGKAKALETQLAYVDHTASTIRSAQSPPVTVPASGGR